MDFKRPLMIYMKSKVLRPNAAIYFFLTLASGIGLALIFASGHLIQAITIAFFSGHTSSIYDGENVGQLIDAEAYIEAALWPPFIAAGIISAAAMAIASTKRSLLVNGTIAIGLSLTLIDFFSVGTEGLMASVLCNFAAGFILSILTLVIALNLSSLQHLSEGNLKLEKILWVLSPLAGYTTLAAIIFFILSFLTTIPDTPSSFRLEPPLSGYYVTKETRPCSSQQELKSQEVACASRNAATNQDHDIFSVLGKFNRATKGDVDFVGEGDGITLEWLKRAKGQVTASLWVAQGCVDKNEITKVKKSHPIYQGPIDKLLISLDKGMSEFRMIEQSPAVIEIADDDIAQFWISPSDKDREKLKVSRFLGKGKISMQDSYAGSTFEVGLFPLSGQKQGPTFRPRRITYAIDQNHPKTIDIVMNPKPISPGANLTCEYLSAKKSGDGYSVTTNSPYVSLIYKTDPPGPVNLNDFGPSNQFVISEANGWVESSGYPKLNLDDALAGGRLTQLSVVGTIKDLVVDGQAIQTGSTSTLQVNGKIVGRPDGPSILMVGKADYLIFNGKRLSTTRWERLDSGVRIPIILGIPTAAFFALNFIVSTLRRSSKGVWHPPRTGYDIDKQHQ